jgi:hypothetical protein
VVQSQTIARALTAHPTLTAEQVALVWALAGSGHGIENVEAGAGAGKTYALRVTVDPMSRDVPDGRGWFRTSDLSRVKQSAKAAGFARFAGKTLS